MPCMVHTHLRTIQRYGERCLSKRCHIIRCLETEQKFQTTTYRLVVRGNDSKFLYIYILVFKIHVPFDVINAIIFLRYSVKYSSQSVM